MNCFLIAADRDDPRARSLAKLAASLGYTVTLCTGLDGLRANAAFTTARRVLVLVPALPQSMSAVDTVKFAREEVGRAFVVYVADTLAPELYKALIRSEAGEWVGWGTCAQEMAEIAKTLSGSEATERAAKVISFLPSKGGVGNTMLAVESGMHLSTRRKRPVRVALLDLNLQGGTLADALDIAPRFDIGEIVAQPERLDEQLIDVFTSRHTPRLDVFACPPSRIALGEVPPQILFTFIDAIAKRYEAILIDLPRAWVAWIDNILQGSDAVVLSGGATVPSLRSITQSLTHLDGLDIPAARISVSVNPCEADLLGRVVRRNEIERPLGGRTVFCIRRDAAAADGALDAGRSLLEMSPGAKISRDIRCVAEWCGITANLA